MCTGKYSSGGPTDGVSKSVASELLEAFRAGEGVDLIRESVRLVMQDLIEVEASEVLGADRCQRSGGRVTQRNGSRPRLVATQAGDVELRIPKLRQGSFLPVILERRRRIDQALNAVLMEAWVNGVSTRAVDDLVAASPPAGRRAPGGGGDGPTGPAELADPVRWTRDDQCADRRVPIPLRRRRGCRVPPSTWWAEWASSLSGITMASDGYLPFRDNIEHAALLGVNTILEPGGSTRTSEVAASAKAHGIDLIETGLRLFHH